MGLDMTTIITYDESGSKSRKEIENAIKLLVDNGYFVTLEYPMPNIQPCVCGRTVIAEYSSKNGYSRKCPKCNLAAPWGKTRRESIDNWNKVVDERLTKE